MVAIVFDGHLLRQDLKPIRSVFVVSFMFSGYCSCVLALCGTRYASHFCPCSTNTLGSKR